MRVFDDVARLPAPARIALIIAMMLVIGYIDYVTGAEIAISIFYTIPVSLAAWSAPRRAAIGVALLCGVVWLSADFLAEHVYTSGWIPYWNAGVRVSFFVMITLLVARVRRSLANEHETARIDWLTRLPNARHFTEESARELSRCQRHGHPITIAYFDLDNFKLVNDRMGHARGDDLLREIAAAMTSRLRAQDTLARVGGDEFALLLPETGTTDALLVLERMGDAVRELARKQSLPVGVSIGAVTYPVAPDSIDEMVKRADALMYDVKQTGKGSIRHVTSESARVAPTVAGPTP
jgi:diguanylate cyclase (GGDEF)-like protein